MATQRGSDRSKTRPGKAPAGAGGRAPYDPNKDRLYATFKNRDEKLGEGVKIELRSYNGAEPRVKVTRFYRDDKNGGKWTEDTQRVFPRFRVILFSWLLSAGKEMDRGYDDWEREKRGGVK